MITPDRLTEIRARLGICVTPYATWDQQKFVKNQTALIVEDVPYLLAAVDRVWALHSSEDGQWCDACTFSYPCRTIRALTGGDDA